MMKSIVNVFFLFCAVTVLSLTASASTIWHEGDLGEGDAGGQLASGNVVFGFGSLTEIIGSFGTNQTTSGADMYEIFIADPSTFSLTTVADLNNPVVDPSIFLFAADGTGIVGNDNASGVSTQSSIPAGNTNSLTPGLYFVLITPSGNLPEDKNNNSIFGSIGGTTGVVTGSNGPLKKYGGTPSGDDAGRNYDILLTGADFVAPEPATMAFTGLGIALLAWRARRARHASPRA
jgi:hypothetical protein